MCSNIWKCGIQIQWEKNWIGHINEYPTKHHIIWNPRQTQSMIALYDFDLVFLESPVLNCIVGMFLTCPIMLMLIYSSSYLTYLCSYEWTETEWRMLYKHSTQISFWRSHHKCEYTISKKVITGGGEGRLITPNLMNVHGVISWVIVNKRVTLCQLNLYMGKAIFE